MSSIDASGQDNEDKNKFCPGNRTTHDKSRSPYMDEFSELLKKVPSDILWNELATSQQRQLATSLWEATNYGGKPKPGQFKDVEPKRQYLEWVLRMEHDKQWHDSQKKRYTANN